MKKYLLSLLSFCLAAVAVNAQKPEVVTEKSAGWHKIAEAKVNFKSDKDQFIILGADRFKSIQVRVKDAAVHIEDMQIQYEGGTKEDITLRSDFKAGAASRVIDLKNNSAELRKVTFVYKTVPNATADKAQVELWGLK